VRAYSLERVERLHPDLGAEIKGADACAASAELVETMRAALLEHHLVVLRDQRIGPAELAEFTRRFGVPEEFDRSPFPDHPQVLRISNLEGKKKYPPPFWHSDGLLQPEPPALSFFYAEQAPRAGGDTLFLNTQRAYDELAEQTKDLVDGLRSVQMNGAEHPLVRTHPVTGRRALFLDLGFTVRVAGLDRDEAVELFTRLKQHFERPGATYRHRFRRGDLLIWDNASTAHSATPAPDASQPRVMLRATVRGGPTG
jgi:taurine dioxygenase